MIKRLEFTEQARNGQRKTKYWLVSCNGIDLGHISFYSRWRQYCFHPDTETLYEKNCLREIADKCESESKALRATWTRKKV